MTKKEKVYTFQKELMWIKNKDIRIFAVNMLGRLPDYFFVVPASSTGKYHPEYSLGEGGLVKHTKSAVLIAKTLLDLEQYQNEYNEEQRDIILLAYFLDMTDQEIADKLNAVRRTVQYKRVRALENMRIGLEVMTDGNSNVEEE